MSNLSNEDKIELEIRDKITEFEFFLREAVKVWSVGKDLNSLSSHSIIAITNAIRGWKSV